MAEVALQQPTISLNALFFEHHTGNFMATLEKIEALFCSFLEDAGQVSRIPVLSKANVHTLTPWTLVRFRGMIQDMGTDTELCQVSVDAGTHQTTIYREDFCDLFGGVADKEAGYVERCRFHCVGIPGQSLWATQEYERCDAAPHCSARSGLEGHDDIRPGRKRELGEEETEEEALRSALKKQRAVNDGGDDGSESLAAHAMEHTSQLECVVKMYCVGQRQCRLNEIIEFVGILHPLTPASDKQEGAGADTDALPDQQFDSTSGCVRCSLHALTMAKAPSVFWRSPPVTPQPYALFDQLVDFLTSRLAGDRLCAMYVLLHMCSGVYDRKGSLMLGALPLNVVGRQAAVAWQAIRGVWDLLLERHSSVQLDLPSLQADSFLPAKDFQRDCLRRAPLQLAPRTFLAIDETALAEGRLNEQGIRNLTQLKSIVEVQTAAYDFHYHVMDVETDFPSVVFSHSKSLLHSSCICVLPFEPQTELSDHLLPLEPPLPLEGWRRLLSTAQHQPVYHISEVVKEAVEEDIAVEMGAHPQRFNRSAVVQHNTLHLWFTLARLLALARGRTELSMDLWAEVKALESQRHARLHP